VASLARSWRLRWTRISPCQSQRPGPAPAGPSRARGAGRQSS
jgi:hypothetical protein